MSEDSLKLDRQICFRLYKASRTMTRLYQPLLETLEITYPQYITMLVLWEVENIDFKDLGTRLDLKTGTMTPIVTRLESLGYVYRVKNKDDNRRIWVRLTDSGRALKLKAQNIPESLNQYMKMGQEQYQRYALLLDELGDLLTDAEKKQK